jgi:hypothetical protein
VEKTKCTRSIEFGLLVLVPAIGSLKSKIESWWDYCSRSHIRNVWGCGSGAAAGKDVPDWDPDQDIEILRRTWGGVDPLADCFPEQRFYTSRAIIDACHPYEHLASFPPVAEPSAELRAKVLSKWRDIFC